MSLLPSEYPPPPARPVTRLPCGPIDEPAAPEVRLPNFLVIGMLCLLVLATVLVPVHATPRRSPAVPTVDTPDPQDQEARSASREPRYPTPRTLRAAGVSNSPR